LIPRGLPPANINPKTRLATDYLNHFNEAIMLLDIPAGNPGMHRRADRMGATELPGAFRRLPRSATRELAIAAYEAAEPIARACALDELADTMKRAAGPRPCEALLKRSSLDFRRWRLRPRPPRASSRWSRRPAP